MPKPYFVVRATVHDPSKREAFDSWYKNVHLPDALRLFGVKRAWRCWSLADSIVHEATYEFADQESLAHAIDGGALKQLIDDFNRDWPEVTRTREAFTLAEEVGA
jgi:hypothetical protein